MTTVINQQTNDADATAELLGRRRRVGLVAAAFGIGAGCGFILAPADSAWPAACLRIGIVFGSLWLCLPVRHRPRVWKTMSPGRLIGLAVLAILANRLKYFFPLIGVLSVLALIFRPRRAATQLRR